MAPLSPSPLPQGCGLPGCPILMCIEDLAKPPGWPCPWRSHPTYVIDELLDHAVPLALVVLCPIFPVLHQPDLVGEAQDVGQFLKQVDAVSLKPVIPKQGPVRLPEHDKGLLLWGQIGQGLMEAEWVGQGRLGSEGLRPGLGKGVLSHLWGWLRRMAH